MYDGEDYVIQLDSHHKFVPKWDRILLRMIKETGSNKPILSTYGTPYFTDKQFTLDLTPTRIKYHGFNSQGILTQKPVYMDNYKNLKSPEPSRFISGHFLFTTGDFIKDVPYDPELYFTGEEISIAARAYTSGYDLFHPNKLVIWHLYDREPINGHLYDHDPYKNKRQMVWLNRPDYPVPKWVDHEVTSVRRIRTLLNTPPTVRDPIEYHTPMDLGKYTLGSARTLRDYERYTGINFKLKSAHGETEKGHSPPGKFIIGDDYEWDQSFSSTYKVVVEFDKNEIDTTALDTEFWAVVAIDNSTKPIYRDNLGADTFKSLLNQRIIRLSLNVTSPTKPSACMIWPYSKSKGWQTKTVKRIQIK